MACAARSKARWRPRRHADETSRTRPHSGPTPPTPASAAIAAESHVQIVRTIPALTYRFAPAGIYSIAQAYQRALRQAEHFIYLESQYLWVEGLPKLNFTRLGWQSRKMRTVVEELAAAAERGVHIALVLPDHPNVGRAVTDATIDWLCRHAPQAMAGEAPAILYTGNL